MNIYGSFMYRYNKCIIAQKLVILFFKSDRISVTCVTLLLPMCEIKLEKLIKNKHIHMFKLYCLKSIHV